MTDQQDKGPQQAQNSTQEVTETRKAATGEVPEGQSFYAPTEPAGGTPPPSDPPAAAPAPTVTPDSGGGD